MVKECLSQETKDKLIEQADNIADKSGSKIIKFIDRIKTCGKRKRSKYNIFVSKCMKSKTGPVPQRMKSCAIEWKKVKLNI